MPPVSYSSSFLISLFSNRLPPYKESNALIANAEAYALVWVVSSLIFLTVSFSPRHIVPSKRLSLATMKISVTYRLIQLLLTLLLKGFISISTTYNSPLSPMKLRRSLMNLRMSFDFRPKSNAKFSMITVFDCSIRFNRASSSSPVSYYIEWEN